MTREELESEIEKLESATAEMSIESVRRAMEKELGKLRKKLAKLVEREQAQEQARAREQARQEKKLEKQAQQEKQQEKRPERRIGRPALTDQEIYDREMRRLEAKRRAREDFEAMHRKPEQPAPLDERPSFRGRWWRPADQRVISVSEYGTYLEVRHGKLHGGARPVAELTGQWEYMGEEPGARPAQERSRALEATEEHEALTKQYRQRQRELFESMRKPCANYRCTATLNFSDPRRFCESCAEMLKSE